MPASLSRAQWRSLAIVVLDEIVDGESKRPPHDVAEHAAAAAGVDQIRAASMLRLLIEYGAVKYGRDEIGPYVTCRNPCRRRLTAMRSVWKGEFPTRR